MWSFASVTWPSMKPDGGSEYRIAISGGVMTASLNEYCSASLPAAFSIPIVAELPCSRPKSPTFLYCVRIWPFSLRVTSKLTRCEKSEKKAAFRHSIVNWRVGAAPLSPPPPAGAPSRKRASQNGGIAPLGGPGLGGGALGETRLGARKLGGRVLAGNAGPEAR